MNNFAAIDFETANQHQPICSMGIVVVRQGEVVDKIYRLVRPEPNFYCAWATHIHGLSRADTDGALTFDRVWAEVSPSVEGLPLVAHNSPFDERCLRRAHQSYGMAWPGYRFHCTCAASRRVFGATLENHQLHTVAARCGFDLQRHHDALADAEACAAIALKIL